MRAAAGWPPRSSSGSADARYIGGRHRSRPVRAGQYPFKSKARLQGVLARKGRRLRVSTIRRIIERALAGGAAWPMSSGSSAPANDSRSSGRVGRHGGCVFEVNIAGAAEGWDFGTHAWNGQGWCARQMAQSHDGWLKWRTPTATSPIRSARSKIGRNRSVSPFSKYRRRP